MKKGEKHFIRTLNPVEKCDSLNLQPRPTGSADFPGSTFGAALSHTIFLLNPWENLWVATTYVMAVYEGLNHTAFETRIAGPASYPRAVK